MSPAASPRVHLARFAVGSDAIDAFPIVADDGPALAALGIPPARRPDRAPAVATPGVAVR